MRSGLFTVLFRILCKKKKKKEKFLLVDKLKKKKKPNLNLIHFLYNIAILKKKKLNAQRNCEIIRMFQHNQWDIQTLVCVKEHITDTTVAK